MTNKFSFQGDMTVDFKDKIASLVRSKLRDMNNGDPDDLFVEYIVTMVSNSKTMSDISNELKEFMPSDAAIEFTDELGIQIQYMVQEQAEMKTLKLLASKVKIDQPETNSRRLLKSALQQSSSPSTKEAATLHINPEIQLNKINSNCKPHDQVLHVAHVPQKRKVYMVDSAPTAVIHKDEQVPLTNKPRTAGTSCSSSTLLPPPVLTEPFDAKSYMNQMTSMATSLGFERVEDMVIMQQQQMLLALQHQNPPRKHLGGCAGRLGQRGNGLSTSRGRGYHNRNLTYIAPEIEEVSQRLSSFTPINNQVVQNDSQTIQHMHPASNRGRGWLRGGRHYRVRGGQAKIENKKWVREPDMQTSLVSGR